MDVVFDGAVDMRATIVIDLVVDGSDSGGAHVHRAVEVKDHVSVCARIRGRDYERGDS